MSGINVEILTKRELHHRLATRCEQLADLNLTLGHEADAYLCREWATKHRNAATKMQADARMYTAEEVLELVRTALGKTGG